MAYDQFLAERIQHVLNDKSVLFHEKKMMGGLCFMVNDKMCLGVVGDSLMARINPEEYDHLLKRNGAKPMDFTGRPMKGFLFVDPKGIDFDRDLEEWIQLCLDYNPKAKSSKKK